MIGRWGAILEVSMILVVLISSIVQLSKIFGVEYNSFVNSPSPSTGSFRVLVSLKAFVVLKSLAKWWSFCKVVEALVRRLEVDNSNSFISQPRNVLMSLQRRQVLSFSISCR